MKFNHGQTANIFALFMRVCAALVISFFLILPNSSGALETPSIDTVRQTAKLTEIAQEMKYLDEILTASVLRYVFTHDPKWLDRYVEHESKLSALFTEAMTFGVVRDQGIIERIKQANSQLNDMESVAIKLAKQGHGDEAQKIFNSADYRSNKEKYALALAEFFATIEALFKEEVTDPKKVQSIDLTASEKAWLSDHPTIRIGVDTAYPPYEFVDDQGSYRGIAPEYLKLMGQRLGIEFKVVSGLTWEQVVEGIKDRNVDMAPVITDTEQRRRFMNFTHPYLTHPDVIFTRDDFHPISGLAELAGKKMAIPEGFSEIGEIKEKYPTIEIIEVKNLLEALTAVVTGKADATQGNLAVMSYLLQQNSITNLKVAAQPDTKGGALSMGVRKDWPEFVAILEKALDSITQEELQSIRSKWIAIAVMETEREKLGLSVREQNWLSAHETIRLGIDTAWPPIEFLDEEGKHAGISSGYADAVSKRLEISLRVAQDLKWSDVIAKIKDRELDILSAVARTPEREAYLNFTKPYITAPIIIATNKDASLISELNDLEGKTVGVVPGYASTALLRANHPLIKLVEMPDVATLLEALSAGKIEAVVESLWVISYEIDRLELDNIKVAAPTPYNYELSMGVRKDWPELVPILDKALSSLDKQEKNAIKNSWTAVRVQFGLDLKTILLWALPIGGSGILVILVIVVWNRKLGTEIAERKRAERELLFTQYAVDQAAEAVFWVKPDDGALDYVNETACTNLGYTRQELLKMYISQVDIDFPAEKFSELMKMLAEQRFATFESRHRKKNGDVFDVEVRAYLAEYEGRQILIANTMDISEQKKAAAALKIAHQELGEAMEHIEGSINYASRIQQSILPREDALHSSLPDLFVLWEPRDIVGGDIYWARPWGGGELIMLGDCTGHGVPGAFMTMISSGALDQAYLEIPVGDTARLLQRMHQIIQESLGQERKDGASDDGLEVGACYLPENRQAMIFSGARFSLFVVEDGEVTEIKGDKSGLGYRGISHDVEFTNQEVEIKPQRRYYMTSDGLIDQIGGERKRGFGKRRFKKLITSLNNVPMVEQKIPIQKALADYQGEEKRRDDVSVLGFAVSDESRTEQKAKRPKEYKIDLPDQYIVGFDEIDDDHRKLFELIEALNEAIETQDRTEIESNLIELYEYTRWHFRHEERLMQATSYPEADHHKGKHQDLVDEVLEIKQKFENGDDQIVSSVPKFLRNWLFDHIEKIDKNLAKFLNDAMKQ